MSTKIKIKNPTLYTRTEEVVDTNTGEIKKVAHQMIAWETEGSPEALKQYHEDACARAGKEVSKGDNGNPLHRLNLATGYMYGTENTLERTVLPNGEAAWVAENNDEIKSLSNISNDENLPDFIKADAMAQQKQKFYSFLTVANVNTAKKRAAYRAKQNTVNDSFTQIPS